MAVSAPNRRVTAPARRTRTSSPRISRSADGLQHTTPDTTPVDLESLSACWQRALDAANGALRAVATELSDPELRVRATALRRERDEVVQLLAEVARESRPQPEPWLSPVPVTNAMLGLPAAARACLFDVEGVLTDSALLHAWAWGEVFDRFLTGVSEKAERHFIPFDRALDYRTYVEGRPRLEGVHSFLASRGIEIAEGRPGDPADSDTAYGLAKRKGGVLARRLEERGVTALPGARRYLEAARRAGLKRAVVSASTNTSPILERAGLSALIDERLDAAVIRTEGLRSRPAPDLLLAGCRRLDVAPADTVTFTNTAAGVAAGRSAGVTVIGVAAGDQGETLRGFGAELVVPRLEALVDPRLLQASAAPSTYGQVARGRP